MPLLLTPCSQAQRAAAAEAAAKAHHGEALGTSNVLLSGDRSVTRAPALRGAAPRCRTCRGHGTDCRKVEGALGISWALGPLQVPKLKAQVAELEAPEFKEPELCIFLRFRSVESFAGRPGAGSRGCASGANRGKQCHWHLGIFVAPGRLGVVAGGCRLMRKQPSQSHGRRHQGRSIVLARAERARHVGTSLEALVSAGRCFASQGSRQSFMSHAAAPRTRTLHPGEDQLWNKIEQV